MSSVAWTTLAIAIWGAVLGTANAIWAFFSWKARTRSERRVQASRAVGGAAAFLHHIEPETFSRIRREMLNPAISEFADMWDACVRDLEALRVADPRQEVEAQIEAAITAVTEAFTSTCWKMRQRRDEGALSDSEWADLHARYDAATIAVEDLKHVVRS
jgi:hypothetical protein